MRRAIPVRLRAVRMCVGVAVPTVFMFAGIGKYLDWPVFVASLDGYELLSHGVRKAAVFLIPGLELLPITLVFLNRIVVANVLCAILLGLFVGVTWWHWANHLEPNCSCFGVWAQYIEVEDGFRHLVVRNSILAGISLTAIVVSLLAARKEQAEACVAS